MKLLILLGCLIRNSRTLWWRHVLRGPETSCPHPWRDHVPIAGRLAARTSPFLRKFKLHFPLSAHFP